MVKKNKIVSVVGASYLDYLVPYCLKHSLSAYLNRKGKVVKCSLSPNESSFASAGIMLSVVALESVRNRIYFLEKMAINKQAYKDLSKVIVGNPAIFDPSDLDEVLEECFVIRDVIVHNHIYSIDIDLAVDWSVKRYRQVLQDGYGTDQKFGRVKTSRKKTKYAGFNIQPLLIGMVDFLKLLIVVDLVIGLINKNLGNQYIQSSVYYEFKDGVKVSNFSELITYYYHKLATKDKNNIDRLCSKLHKRFSNYVGRGVFVSNICPVCKKGFGYQREAGYLSKCRKKNCGHKIECKRILDSNPM